MFSVLGKLNLFKLGRGESTPSAPFGHEPEITQLHLDNSVLNDDVEWRTPIWLEKLDENLMQRFALSFSSPGNKVYGSFPKRYSKNFNFEAHGMLMIFFVKCNICHSRAGKIRQMLMLCTYHAPKVEMRAMKCVPS